MAKSISRTEKRGRGRPRINPTSIHLSLAPDLLARVDKFLSGQKDNPSRPEAVRRLVELGLAGMQPMRRRSPKAGSKALDLAGNQIDKLVDRSATDEERQKRKRRLLKRPKELREIRDHNFSKSKS